MRHSESAPRPPVRTLTKLTRLGQDTVRHTALSLVTWPGSEPPPVPTPTAPALPGRRRRRPRALRPGRDCGTPSSPRRDKRGSARPLPPPWSHARGRSPAAFPIIRPRRQKGRIMTRIHAQAQTPEPFREAHRASVLLKGWDQHRPALPAAGRAAVCVGGRRARSRAGEARFEGAAAPQAGPDSSQRAAHCSHAS